MKTKYIVIAFFVLILMQTASIGIIMYQSKENNRIYNNMSQLARGQLSFMKVYTKKEFKNFEPGAVALAETLGFKTNQIDHYIETMYNIKDTTIVSHYTKVDSIPDIRYFSITRKCTDFAGVSYPDSITMQTWTYDTVKTFLYREPNKEIFWPIRWLSRNRWIHTAVSFSACTGDTLSVIKNVKVGDKE